MNKIKIEKLSEKKGKERKEFLKKGYDALGRVAKNSGNPGKYKGLVIREMAIYNVKEKKK